MYCWVPSFDSIPSSIQKLFNPILQIKVGRISVFRSTGCVKYTNCECVVVKVM